MVLVSGFNIAQLQRERIGHIGSKSIHFTLHLFSVCFYPYIILTFNSLFKHFSIFLKWLASFKVRVKGKNLMYVLLFLCFSLDPEQKEMLIEVIEKLLKDKSTVSNTLLCQSTSMFYFIVPFYHHIFDIIILVFKWYKNGALKSLKNKSIYVKRRIAFSILACYMFLYQSTQKSKLGKKSFL